MSAFRVTILGGYGAFGSRVARLLAKEGKMELLIAGRDLQKANKFAGDLKKEFPKVKVEGISLDASNSSLLQKELKRLRPNCLINTTGPFQGQKYTVPEACIEARTHYIDLADSREFCVGISGLDAKAKEANVFVTSGASSVPSISAAAVDYLQEEFSSIEKISHFIIPGNKNTPRGNATVGSILSYVGQPYKQWEGGKWVDVIGWGDLRRSPPMAVWNKRPFLSNCNVPDLELFPQRYPTVKTVQFQAGLEISFLHLSLYLFSLLPKWGIIKSLQTYTPFFRNTAELFRTLGGERGLLAVEVSGMDKDNNPCEQTWYIVADNGDGPFIPASPAAIIATKLASGEITQRGAFPCLGMFDVYDLKGMLGNKDIKQFAMNQYTLRDI